MPRRRQKTPDVPSPVRQTTGSLVRTITRDYRLAYIVDHPAVDIEVLVAERLLGRGTGWHGTRAGMGEGLG